MGGKALEGVRVLELCSMISGPYCTKLMGDLGAQVIKVEAPNTGDEARMRGPFPGDVPHQEKSGLFLFLNTNKLGITLNINTSPGREIFKELVKKMDVLVADRPAGEMEASGLGYEDMRKINPGIIMASITPFGESGPYRDYGSHLLNTSHVSGQGYILPLPSPHLNRPPVKMGGNSSEYDPGQIAGIAILGALFSKGSTGKGQFIEISKQESLLSLQRVESVAYPNDGMIMKRLGPSKGLMVTVIYVCKDGHVIVSAPLDHQWEGLMELIGNPEWSEWDWCKDMETRSDNAEELRGLIGEWMKEHGKEEICRRGQALGCPISPINNAQDIVESEQLKSRGFFLEMDHAVAGRFMIPTTCYHFERTPWALERPAPLLGEHNEGIYCGLLEYSREEVAEFKQKGIL